MNATSKIAAILALFISTPAWCEENVYEYSSRPYEGVPYFRVHTDELELRSQPSEQDKILNRLKIKKDSIVTTRYVFDEVKRKKIANKLPGVNSIDSFNQQIFFDKSIQKTIKPGVIRAVQDGSFVHYRQDSGEMEIIHFNEGDFFEELLYIGEGNCKHKIQGKIMDTGCLLYDMENKDRLKRVSPIQTEWWIRLMQDNKSIGWIKIDQENGPLRVIGTKN